MMQSGRPFSASQTQSTTWKLTAGKRFIEWKGKPVAGTQGHQPKTTGAPSFRSVWPSGQVLPGHESLLFWFFPNSKSWPRHSVLEILQQHPSLSVWKFMFSGTEKGLHWTSLPLHISLSFPFQSWLASENPVCTALFRVFMCMYHVTQFSQHMCLQMPKVRLRCYNLPNVITV